MYATEHCGSQIVFLWMQVSVFPFQKQPLCRRRLSVWLPDILCWRWMAEISSAVSANCVAAPGFHPLLWDATGADTHICWYFDWRCKSSIRIPIKGKRCLGSGSVKKIWRNMCCKLFLAHPQFQGGAQSGISRLRIEWQTRLGSRYRIQSLKLEYNLQYLLYKQFDWSFRDAESKVRFSFVKRIILQCASIYNYNIFVRHSLLVLDLVLWGRYYEYNTHEYKDVHVMM